MNWRTKTINKYEIHKIIKFTNRNHTTIRAMIILTFKIEIQSCTTLLQQYGIMLM